MASQNSEKKEPLKLKIILPLLAIILILIGIFEMIHFSKSTYNPLTPLELSDSFSAYISKFKERDHFKFFVGQKKVTLLPGPSLSEFLQSVDGSELISSVDLTYNIPVFTNLVGEWVFNLKETDFRAQVPLPTLGEPIFDPSSLVVHFKSEVSEDKQSVLRDILKESLVGYQVTMDPTTQSSLESQSRQKVQELLQAWLKATYKNIPELKYTISFTGSKNSENNDEP